MLLFRNSLFFKLIGTALENKEIFLKHAVDVDSSRLRNTQKSTWPLIHWCYSTEVLQASNQTPFIKLAIIILKQLLGKKVKAAKEISFVAMPIIFTQASNLLRLNTQNLFRIYVTLNVLKDVWKRAWKYRLLDTIYKKTVLNTVAITRAEVLGI